MNCSFSSSLSNAKPFLCHARISSCQKRGQGKPSTVISCRARGSENDESCCSTNLYRVLSLNSNEASFDEIKRPYRTMARRYHPDACHDPSTKQESTMMFVQLHAAYKTLSDPVLRQEYDCRLSCRNSQGTFRRPGFADDQCSRTRWQQQIQELKRRSNYRMTQKEGSWRAKNNQSNAKY